MRPTRASNRRGMTLVELMVVVAILGLLAVAVFPLLGGSSKKNLLRETAATVDGHINQAISKSIGSRTGFGVWIQSDTTSAVSPVSTLAFCPGTTHTSGSATFTLAAQTDTTVTASTPLISTTPVPSGCLLSFVGFPYDYELTAASTVSLRNSVMQTTSNMAWPGALVTATTGTLSYTVSIPPTGSKGTKVPLRGNACIDLPLSTVGVYGYSTPAATLTNDGPLILTFDSLGRVRTATYTTGSSATPIQRRLDARTPIALLVGMRDQVGQAIVSAPDEDNPGSNLQRADTFWVVLDPRSSTTFIVENAASGVVTAGSGTAGISAAQRFIVQTLKNL